MCRLSCRKSIYFPMHNREDSSTERVKRYRERNVTPVNDYSDARIN